MCIRGYASSRVETGFETSIQFSKILFEAPYGVSTGGILSFKANHRGLE